MARQLFKSSLIVASMTLISRILGFVRDMLIARIFGVDLATDAFFVAFKIPNFLRRLFVEGAFAHAFVSVLSEYKTQSSQAVLKLFVDRTSGTLAVILLLVSLVGVLVAPVLILLLAPGFSWQGEQHELAVLMLQITFPYLFFIGIVAFFGSILNAYGRFAVPAITPAILNICMIAAAIGLAPLMQKPVVALAWGVFAAGLFQVLFQLPALIRLGLLPSFRLGFYDPGVRRALQLMLPAIFSVSVTQINLLLDTLVASFLTVGSVSWLYYSDRLVEFPLGILGVALATVILPGLAKSHVAQDSIAFSAALDWGLRLVFLVGVPATLGLLLLAEPMLSTLFQYKEFSVSDVHMAGKSLRAYAIGLLAFIMIKILVSGFTSRQDMQTPVRYGVYAMIVSLALNVLLVFPLAHAGLALATSLAAFFNAALLLSKLLRERIYQPGHGWRLFLFRIAFASAVMSACLYYFVDADWWKHWSAKDRVINILKWIFSGVIVYLATLLLTGLRPRHLIHTHGKIENF
ncbi:MAG: murein biosynthesis integral membrane protein MurJ [Methylococcaceae bacterium]|nr:murein biosynthesis integral membrane protein MurJ [Methylococcaceae bacterium]